MLHPVVPGDERADRAEDARLDEAIGLASAIEIELVHAEIVPLRRQRPATLFGSGAVERLEGLLTELDVQLVIIDAPLSPVQQRNLEKSWKCKVIDRTGLILEIFGARARTYEGRLQVELAALSYQRSRLVRSWTHLERQRGGLGFVGGPGESQLEIDRRLIDERMAKLRRQLERVTRTRGLHRAARKKVPYPVVALVGYTNAGKSTLFNRVADAKVEAKDQLFATLDPTMRAVALPSGRQIILSDTVGFVADLPTQLVAAFRATLEEVLDADLLVHVRDISHPETAAQKKDVEEVLVDLGISEGDVTIIEALNKLDRVDEEQRERLFNVASRQEGLVPVSALTGEGLEELFRRIDQELGRVDRAVEITLPASDGATLAWLYRHGDVLSREDDIDSEELHLSVRLAPADVERLARRIGNGTVLAGEGRQGGNEWHPLGER